MRRAGEGAVTDLEFNDILARGLELAGSGQHGEGGLGGQVPRQRTQSDHGVAHFPSSVAKDVSFPTPRGRWPDVVPRNARLAACYREAIP